MLGLLGHIPKLMWLYNDNIWCVFCRFPFRWIYYCHSSKSTEKETGVLTDPKSVSIAQEFVNSKPNTIWLEIYEKQMSDESFMPISEATRNILQKDQLLTQYSEVESMMYNTKPCQLKTLWKSSSKDHHSIAFQKGCTTFQPCTIQP